MAVRSVLGQRCSLYVDLSWGWSFLVGACMISVPVMLPPTWIVCAAVACSAVAFGENVLVVPRVFAIDASL